MDEQLLALTADIVVAHVGHNTVSASDMPSLIKNVHEALAGLGSVEPVDDAPTPAVSVRSSVKPDMIICLECGAKQKALKRHLNSAHSISPAEYRAKWELKPDYPMVAPNYARQRSEMAKQIGLGRKPKKAR